MMLRFRRQVPLVHLLALAPLLFAGACQSTDPKAAPVMVAGYSMEPTLEAPSDDSAVGQFLVQHLRDTRVVEGLRQVDLDLENRSPNPVAFAYQVEWLDHQGELVIDGGALWTPVLLDPGERVPLALRAPHPRAESWRLLAVALRLDS